MIHFLVIERDTHAVKSAAVEIKVHLYALREDLPGRATTVKINSRNYPQTKNIPVKKSY